MYNHFVGTINWGGLQLSYNRIIQLLTLRVMINIKVYFYNSFFFHLLIVILNKMRRFSIRFIFSCFYEEFKNELNSWNKKFCMKTEGCIYRGDHFKKRWLMKKFVIISLISLSEMILNLQWVHRNKHDTCFLYTVLSCNKEYKASCTS